jgi:hypothetical protein
VPPLPALHTPLMIGLERLSRAVPRGALPECIQRAEALAAEIEPTRQYPDDWLVFRLMGTRHEAQSPGIGGVTTTSGADVLQDLSSLVERWSVGAGFTEKSLLDEGGTRAADLALRWSMSRKTLDRLRRRGLLARRGAASRAKHVLVFMPATVEAFEKQHRDALADAATYSRLTVPEQRQVLEQYAALRAAGAVSITAAAKQLAAAHGRSVEGIRLFLKKHAKKVSGSPADTGPINADVRRVLVRASRSGLDLAHLAQRFGRTRPAVRRAVVLGRAEALWVLRDAGHLITPTSATSKGAAAGEALLTQPMVRQGLGARGETDLLDLIRAARHSPPPTGAEERARLLAYQFIRAEAARLLNGLDRLHPKAPVVDRVETLLRWAARLKAEVLRPHLRLILQTVEGRLGRRAEEIRPSDLVPVLQLALREAGHTFDLLDGSKSGRVAGPIGLAADKVLVEWLKRRPSVDPNPRRAAAILTFGAVISDWTLQVSPWQRWLEPDPRVRAAAEAGGVPKEMASLLAARFGWAGPPPMTLAELAKERGLTHIRAAMLVHESLQRAMDAARGGRRTQSKTE